MIITMMVSAFWHGFYPCYYLGFLHLAFVLHLTKLGYKMYKNTLINY